MSGRRVFQFAELQRKALEGRFPSEVAQRIVQHATNYATIGNKSRLSSGQIHSEIEKLDKIVAALRDALLNIGEGVDDTITAVAYQAGSPGIFKDLVAELRQFEAILGRALQLSEPQAGRPRGSGAVALVLEIARELEAGGLQIDASTNGALCFAAHLVFEALGESPNVTKLVDRALTFRSKRQVEPEPPENSTN